MSVPAPSADRRKQLVTQVKKMAEEYSLIKAKVDEELKKAFRPEFLNRVDEIGMILRAVNQSGLNLRSLVDDVSEQVGGLQTASSEIAQGNSDLSARTEQTASNLEQTAASMDQMNATVKHNADTARQAAQLANSASAAAATGGAVFGQVVGTMDAITTATAARVFGW